MGTSMSDSKDAVTLTRKLVKMDTVNPTGNTEQCSFYLGKLLEDAGYAVEYYEHASHSPSLIAKIGGTNDKSPICFTGHIDTVPLGLVPWNIDPFSAEIENGKLYGRGSSDMKSGVAAFVAAALELAPSLTATPGLTLVITAGEETGCEGALHISRLHKQKGILGSAGAIVVAEPTSNYPLVGHKGALWLNAKTRGKSAHGSMPEQGDNAIYKAARGITLLEGFDFGVTPHPLMGKATLNVGTMKGGINVNSVPDEAVFSIDVRTVPGMRGAEITKQLAQHLSNNIELTPYLSIDCLYTEPSNIWIQGIFNMMSPLLGEKIEPRHVSFFTDAAVLVDAFCNPPAIILGPGEPKMAHQTDEYCYLHRIEQAVSAYLQIIRDWCRI
jgi:succinyl-diaminopimelate desuccinylase